MSDDHSPGDRRQPYLNQGEPEARHSETHDVRREELTNPVGPQLDDPSFAEQLAPLIFPEPCKGLWAVLDNLPDAQRRVRFKVSGPRHS